MTTIITATVKSNRFNATVQVVFSRCAAVEGSARANFGKHAGAYQDQRRLHVRAS